MDLLPVGGGRPLGEPRGSFSSYFAPNGMGPLHRPRPVLHGDLRTSPPSYMGPRFYASAPAAERARDFQRSREFDVDSELESNPSRSDERESEATLAFIRDRKKRKRTTQDQLELLVKIFNCYANPDSVARQMIGRKIGMTQRAVQVWFQNRRALGKNQGQRIVTLQDRTRGLELVRRILEAPFPQHHESSGPGSPSPQTPTEAALEQRSAGKASVNAVLNEDASREATPRETSAKSQSFRPWL